MANSAISATVYSPPTKVGAEPSDLSKHHGPDESGNYINGGVVTDARFDHLNLEFKICLEFRA
jgi:hypothetical protein